MYVDVVEGIGGDCDSEDEVAANCDIQTWTVSCIPFEARHTVDEVAD